LLRRGRALGRAHRGDADAAGRDGRRRHRRRLAGGAAVLVTSRSFEEYVAMFALDEAQLPGLRVLDCCAGASTFVAAARARGCQAVAVDPVYAVAGAELAQRAADG